MNYQVMPDLSNEDYRELKSDIAARGVMVAIEFDEDGNVLDGHHRLKACNELGIAEYPTIIRRGMTDAEKRIHARKLNLARRQLSSSQKREVIRVQLAETPEISDKRIASGLGVDHKTVGKQRRDMEGRGEIPHVEKTIDTLGREQPRPQKPETKVCRDCGQEISIDDFYAGKPNCKTCYNQKSEYRDIKGNIIKSNPEVDALFKERGAEILDSIVKGNREIKYTVDDLAEEVQSLVNYFNRNISSCLSSHSELLGDRSSKQKIMTVLSEAETAIEKNKKEYLL